MPLYPEIPAKSIRSFLSQPEHSWNFIEFVLITTFSPRPVITGSITFFLLICALVLIIHDSAVNTPRSVTSGSIKDRLSNIKNPHISNAALLDEKEITKLAFVQMPA